MPDGSIAVLNLANMRVQLFGRDWGFVRRFGSKGDGPGQFLRPSSIAAGGGGEIIVSDAIRNDVQVFSGEGELLQIIGPKGDSKVAWKGDVCGVAGCGDGRMFVSDGTSVVVLS